ncbi:MULTISPECIES: AraC family transcriptional regulator [Clostridium]|uniref:Helix-turn-helix domain-containing protein n=1 Tax=Clostridium frigoriphilum TaxID=443253 RepID=A0ABU7UQY9_9CLOT|nr:AraC family transcriptional regulator [Clostridium sp. DSM 17811]MBU3101803.1 AraC family transcriptional regulator [Clostridium sp. DSM 17811]
MEFKHELVKSNEDISVMFLNMTDAARIIPKHWHNHMEIIYILDGYLKVDINNSSFLVEKNELIVISPRDIHSTTHKDSNTSILLQIPYEILENSIYNFHNIHFECNPSMEDSKKVIYQKDIKFLLKSFAEIYQNQPLGYKLKVNSLIFDLLFILVNQFSIYLPELKIQKTDRYLERLSLITKYVKENYKECISLETISSKAGLNSEYFSRFFKKYMGTTFLKYLNSVRLEHFYVDLNNSDYSISELIERNGFTNYKIFMKIYKDTYGCTPGETRKLAIKSTIKNSTHKS